MKDIYRDPILYYILVPVLAILWSLSVRTVYLPRAKDNWEREKSQYEQAQKIIAEILALDPDRLKFTDPKMSAAEFDYAIAVDRVARTCGISSINYNLNAKPPRTSGGQKSQRANMVLKDVDITRFARFLSAMQLRWANLQCSQLKLTKTKGLPDRWKVNLEFRYYY